MLIWFSSILTLLAVAADYIHCRRLRHKCGDSRRRAFIAYAVATDALPLLIVLVNAFSRDNTTAFMTFAMWTFWLWMITVLPRMACYILRFIRLPRTGIVVGAAVALLFVWGATAGRTTIKVNRVEVASNRLPAGFDGFCIVQFTDVHIGTIVNPEAELGRIVDSINSLRPDLIAFCGDLVNIRSEELDERAMRILGGLKATHGVVSVIGNHDTGTYIKDSVAYPADENLAEVIARQKQMGWRVLDDTSEYIHHGGDSISLTGISFNPALTHVRHDKELVQEDLHEVYLGIPDSVYNITLAHVPQLWPQITDAGYGDLTLSGHVHSMQMKLKLFGRQYSPAQWLYTAWSGRYDNGRHTLYINDGTGYVGYPMRIGAYPEITLITLRQCE